MLHFIIGCVAIALCVMVGFFILNIVLVAGVTVIAGIVGGIAKLIEFLKGKH